MDKQLRYNVAIVGITGLVGEVLLQVLAQRHFPVGEIYGLASERSVGTALEFMGQPILVRDLAEFNFSKVQFAFFSAGGAVSAQYAPKAAAQGCIVIDNTSHFRYEDDIPLVVPEVNPHALVHYKKRGIIANPNCSTIQMLVALKPIYDAVGIRRINVATYQAVSGAGRAAIHELARQTADCLSGKPVEVSVFPKQIAFNAIPQIDVFQDNGYTKEEMKMVWETRKMMEDPDIMVNPSAVRIPAFYGHSEAIHIETKQAITAEEAKALLKKAPGVILVDDKDYPTVITHAANHDAVFVGRIRKDISCENGLNLWVVADNLRKGAALNAVQIAELLLQQNFSLH